MSFQSHVQSGLYTVRWGREPELGDVPRYAAELAQAHERQGKPLVALFIMPADSKSPSDAVRKEQAAALPDIMSHVHFAVAVFEGTGFVVALKRNALGAIMLLAPKRYAIHVRATVEDALIHDPPKPVPFDARRAIQELRQRKLA